MELFETLLKRRSCRKYLDTEVSDEQIDQILHAAMSAPSACNKQTWQFYVVKNKEVLSKLNKASQFSNINAPLAIVVCGNMSKALPFQMKEFWIQDCSAATENILLAATDMGLGSVWCGIHPQKRAEKKVSDILGLSEKQIPLNIIYIGHPDEEQSPRDQWDNILHKTIFISVFEERV
ncbi:MAG: nitroreductase family protein [Erysipelotrichaceae bacterium]|nr:nitroreductase family protein [Erysipelotrichaceae bacterium]